MARARKETKTEVLISFVYAEAASGIVWGLVWNDIEAPRVDPSTVELVLGAAFTALAVHKWGKYIELREQAS